MIAIANDRKSSDRYSFFVGETPIVSKLRGTRSMTSFDVSNFSDERGNSETWSLIRGRQAVSLQFRSRVDGVPQVSLCSHTFPDERSRAQKLEDRSISEFE